MKKLYFLLFCICLVAQGNAQERQNYRQDMRNFVQGISAYAKAIRPNFVVIPQNGQELLTENGEDSGIPVSDYLKAIDAVGREDLFYGYTEENKPTPAPEQKYMMAFLDLARRNSISVLSIDYCTTPKFVEDSYKKNFEKDYISIATTRELDKIPSYPTTPYHANAQNILKISQAKNFLYLINPSLFSTKEKFLQAVRNTNYDLVVMDLFFRENDPFTLAEITSLKMKQNGGKRMIFSYMSIGEAENYRYYWQKEWLTYPPVWLDKENPNWPGNYKVKYWIAQWQRIIFGISGSYLHRILEAGFDGVYLDIIDAFEYFENPK